MVAFPGSHGPCPSSALAMSIRFLSASGLQERQSVFPVPGAILRTNLAMTPCTARLPRGAGRRTASTACSNRLRSDCASSGPDGDRVAASKLIRVGKEGLLRRNSFCFTALSPWPLGRECLQAFRRPALAEMGHWPMLLLWSSNGTKPRTKHALCIGASISSMLSVRFVILTERSPETNAGIMARSATDCLAG